jgi:hypothetical protein
LTPFKISENASISVYRTLCKVIWHPRKGICTRKPFEQVTETLGHGHSRRLVAEL